MNVKQKLIVVLEQQCLGIDSLQSHHHCSAMSHLSDNEDRCAGTPAWRVQVCMEEKGLQYESRQVEFSKSERTLRHPHQQNYSSSVVPRAHGHALCLVDFILRHLGSSGVVACPF